MPRFDPLSPSFNAGELSPRLWARLDFRKYPAGMETCENLIPLAEGGLARRPGTRYVAALASSAVKGRLKPFQFSTTQAYVVELGDQIMRFYRYQGRIAADDVTGSIANGSFGSDISGWTDKDTGGSAASSWSASGYAALLGDGTQYAWLEQAVTTVAGQNVSLRFRVRGAPGDYVYLTVGSSSGGNEIVDDRKFEVGTHVYTFTTVGTTTYIGFRSQVAKTVGFDDVSILDDTPVELATPYAEADLFRIEGPQSADVLYLFHPDYPTYKLQRYGHTSWSLVEVAWQDGPWLDENDTATTLTFAAATGLGVTVTASSVVGINDGDGFQSTDVGRLIRLTDNTTLNWGWGVIVSVTDTTHVKVDIKRTVMVTTAETTWRLGAWSGTTDYPSCAAFYQQRLFAANTTTQPQTLWASQTSDFEVHSPDSPNTGASNHWDGSVEDDDALDYTLSADEVAAIRWLSPGSDVLVIGTTSSEWVPSSSGIVLTPSDVTIQRQTTHGSAAVHPVRVDQVVLFLQAAKRKVREFAYDFATNGYTAQDMTRLAAHVTYGGVAQMAFAEEPDSLVWAVRNDGQLLSMTFRREEDVVGWARHVAGGSFGSGDAVVESLCVIPGDDGTGQSQVQDSTDRDEVWLIVKRTINGATARYVEVMERSFETGHDQADAYYADSLITYDGAATDTITGLDHLEGETVKVWADGAVHPDGVVSGGSIVLDADYSTVQVGLGYTHKGKTLKLEGGNLAGTALGRTRQYFGVTFAVLNSHTLSFGPDADTLFDIDFREVADDMDAGVPLFTGERFEEFDDGWSDDPRIYFESDDPAPFTLLALAPTADTKSHL